MDEEEFGARRWNELYGSVEPTELSWWSDGLDPDVGAALASARVAGGALCELGTSTGSQATALALRGFRVRAIDVATAAIERARAWAARRRARVDLVVDDVTTTRARRPFRVVLDRGCLHELPLCARRDYAASVARLVELGGCLVLKCFTPSPLVPHGCRPLARAPVAALFAGAFALRACVRTRFHAGRGSPPALLAVLQRVRRG